MNKIKKKNFPFTQVSNELLNDKNISLKAKGIYAYMLSKPIEWNFTIKSMSKQLKEGTDSIMNALNELKNTGWLIYTKNQDGTGVYELMYFPNTENPNKELPKPENPNQGFPNLGKPERINNKDYNNNKDLYKGKEFLKDWNTIRENKLKKPSNCNRLQYTQKKQLEDILTHYEIKDVKNALKALFGQNNIAFSSMHNNPNHFLEKFETYHQAFLDKDNKVYGKKEEVKQTFKNPTDRIKRAR